MDSPGNVHCYSTKKYTPMNAASRGRALYVYRRILSNVRCRAPCWDALQSDAHEHVVEPLGEVGGALVTSCDTATTSRAIIETRYRKFYRPTSTEDVLWLIPPRSWPDARTCCVQVRLPQLDENVPALKQFALEASWIPFGSYIQIHSTPTKALFASAGNSWVVKILDHRWNGTAWSFSKHASDSSMYADFSRKQSTSLIRLLS